MLVVLCVLLVLVNIAQIPWYPVQYRYVMNLPHVERPPRRFETPTSQPRSPANRNQAEKPVRVFVDRKRGPIYARPFPKLQVDVEKREAVKDAFLFAWNKYKEFAWGADFLKPLSKGRQNVFSGGLSITDALDTLIIMGLDKEYELGKEWVEKEFTMNGNYSVFEIVIRHLGSFLACYQLKGDRVFLDKARYIGDAILPLLKEATGYFKTYAKFRTQEDGVIVAVPQGRTEALLSDLGSVQLEMYTLSMLSGDMKYAKRAAKIHKTLFAAFPDAGLYAERINTETGKVHTDRLGVDSMSDSFYEYLIKIWLMTNETMPVMLEKYLMTADALSKQLVRVLDGNLTLLGSLRRGRADNMMTHLATFAPGMLAVGTVRKNPWAEEHLKLADALATSFVKLYRKYPTGLMPECIKHRGNSMVICDSHYRLRPETIESLFVLYRFTGLQKYRDYAWEIFQAIQKSCKVENGYATVKSVNEWPPKHEDLMDSYFLAETMKYLYLIFSSSDVIPTDQYVFNTEAHPLRIWTEKEAMAMSDTLTL